MLINYLDSYGAKWSLVGDIFSEFAKIRFVAVSWSMTDLKLANV